MPTATGSPADPQGYYEALRLPPGSTPESIEKAYASLLEEWRQCQSFARFPVQEAYRFLSDPDQKAAYDSTAALAADEGSENTDKIRPIILAAILTALFLQVGFVFPGLLRPSPDWFRHGDAIVRSYDAAPLGQVVRRAINHRFPHGQIADGYLMRLPDGTERWFPAAELERHYVVTRKSSAS